MKLTVHVSEGVVLEVEGLTWEHLGMELMVGGMSEESIEAIRSEIETFSVRVGDGSMPESADFYPPEFYPKLRTPPKPGVDKDPEPVVQSGDHDPQDEPSGPTCQECGESIHPLDEEAATELYGRVICTKCGRMLQ